MHVSNVTNGGADDMVIGTEMSFDIEEAGDLQFVGGFLEDRRNGKNRATNVTLAQGWRMSA